MENTFNQNWLKKTWWKYTDKEKYRAYKDQLNFHRAHSGISKFAAESKNLIIDEIFDHIARTGEINVVHSGKAGDVIYSLPVVKKLHEMTAMPVNYMLRLNEPLEVIPGHTDDLGSVMLTRDTAENLMELLDSQSYIDKTIIYEGQEIHLDLSLFRELGLDLSRGSLARWNFYTTGINANVTEPWLNVDSRREFSDSIVLARSSRYNNPLIDYSFLSDHKNVVFVGVKSEFKRMKKYIKGLRWQPVNNFLELAEVIQGSKLFIGNQSFPFSVAEALKTLRILEVYPTLPNVIPEGENGYDFCFQNHFEYLVNSLVSKKVKYAGVR